MKTSSNSFLSSDNTEDNNPEHLQKKIQEMQAHIDSLESEIIRVHPAKLDIRLRLRALSTLFLTLVLASIPPALVVADRWLNILSRDKMRDEWCRSTFLCETMLPSYFLVVFACAIGLLIFLFFQRHNPVVVTENKIVSFEIQPIGQNQVKMGTYLIIGSAIGFGLIVLTSLIRNQYPGWELVLVWIAFITGCFLRSYTLESVSTILKRNAEFWVSLLLVHVSIIGVLVGYYSQAQILWIAVILLLLTLANLWRFRKQVPLIFWIVTLSMIIFSIGINNWYFTVIGDEYSFPEFARRLAQDLNFFEIGKIFFKGDGVYGAHPYISSLLQAISIKLLGYGNFSWRFSSLYLSSLSVCLFYLFCKTFISKHLALIAAFLLAVSSYIMSFGKIGYNNLQALFALALVLAITAWAIRSKLIFAFSCLGSALAFCFYTYPVAFYSIPLPFFLLLLYYPPKNWEVAKRWLIMIAVFIVMIFPLMFQPIYWQSKVAGTIFFQSDLIQSWSTILKHFATNILYSFFSFLYIPEENHFLASSYLDPLTAAFFLIGFCILLYQMRRQRFSIFVLVSLLFFMLTVGATHDRSAPPNTRMFLLLPFFVLIAAWGIVWIEEKIKYTYSSRPGTPPVLVPILLVAIAGFNLYQAYPLSHNRSGIPFESLFIHISQKMFVAQPSTPLNYAVVVNETWSIDGFLMLQKLYPHLAWAEIYQIRITEPSFSELSFPLLSQRNTIVILTPWLDPLWVVALDAPLQELGKVPCEITTPKGEKRFVVYHHPDLYQLCDP